MGRQHRGMDGPGVRQVSEGSGEQRKMEESGCEVICGAPTTIAVKGWVKVKVDGNYLPVDRSEYPPRDGVPWTHKLRSPSAVNPELSKVLSF